MIAKDGMTMGNEHLESLSREQLMDLINIYSKNWLALDGLWFQSIEKQHGMDAAMAHDVDVWRTYTAIEARRIKKFLNLEEHPGLEGLRRAMNLRFNAHHNRHEFVCEGDALIFRTIYCRVQDTRARKGMPLHPCIQVGEVEFGEFARAIDDRIRCECVSCYPEVRDESCNCAWRFYIPAEG